MLRKKRKQRGFTLIELIMVIVILGFLAVTAIAFYVNYAPQAADAALEGTLASIRTGFQSYFIDPLKGNLAVWPNASQVCSQGNGVCTACFDGVLNPGLNSPKWSKTGAGAYTFAHPTAAKVCTVAGGGATATTITCV